MPPSCFSSAHFPERSTWRAPRDDHATYLSYVGREQGGVEPMTVYERGTRLNRLDAGVLL